MLAAAAMASPAADEVRVFEVPAQIDTPCLSYSGIGNTRLLLPHALVARTATRASAYDAAGRDAAPGTREQSRRQFGDANAAATLLAARLARLDGDGCRVIASTTRIRIGAYEDGLIARWLLDGKVAVRVGDATITSIRHQPQRDVASTGITGGFRGLTSDGQAIPVLVMPPIVPHHRHDGKR